MSDYVFPYGKHRGESIRDVPADYLEWIVKKNEESNVQMRGELARRKREIPPTLPFQETNAAHIRIVTGGETGVDQGALLAANALNIETGGYAYENWMTEAGCARELLEEFGLKPKGVYNAEYGWNVGIADAVVVFGVLTGGTKLVHYCATTADKPVYHNFWQRTWAENPYTVYQWLIGQQARVICVAGNRESRNPGIGEATSEFMLECLSLYSESKKVPF